MKTPTYKVRATRREDGNYDLSYGKGKKKLTTTTVRDPANGKWFVDVLGHRRKLADIKSGWCEWAKIRYNGVSKADGETAQPDPAQSAPEAMRMKQGGDTGFKVYASDPSDPRFMYPSYPPEQAMFHPEHKQGHMTPLGMLLEVQVWCERYKDRVEATSRILAAERLPGFNPFSFLRMMIDECIEREIPGHEYVAPYTDKESDEEEVC